MLWPKGCLGILIVTIGQSYPGKIQHELAEKHTKEQFKNAHGGDLQRDRCEAAQMCDMMPSAAPSIRRSVRWVRSVNWCIRRRTKSWAISSMPRKSYRLGAHVLSTVQSEESVLGARTIEFQQSQTVEKIVAQFQEDKTDDNQFIPEERPTECTLEQFVDVLGTRVREDCIAGITAPWNRSWKSPVHSITKTFLR